MSVSSLVLLLGFLIYQCFLHHRHSRACLLTGEVGVCSSGSPAENSQFPHVDSLLNLSSSNSLSLMIRSETTCFWQHGRSLVPLSGLRKDCYPLSTKKWRCDFPNAQPLPILALSTSVFK